ncbi:MAG: F0F1 ATP synthase subunit A [Bacilli bacterium]|nr:F0F1 ATP synthase subunit A [Bacilli bacterium]
MIDIWISFSSGMKASLIITAFLMIGITLIGLRVKKLSYADVPGGIILVAVMAVQMFNNMMEDFFKKYWKQFTPYMFTIFLFLGFANTASLVGLATPLSNFTIAISFSALAFGSIQILALIVNKPIKRAKSLMEPHPLFLPINLIGEMSTPFAMGLRLFGNMLSGAIIGIIIYGLLQWVGVVFGALLIHPIFDIFFGLIQAYVYTILFTIFLSMAVED